MTEQQDIVKRRLSERLPESNANAEAKRAADAMAPQLVKSEKIRIMVGEVRHQRPIARLA